MQEKLSRFAERLCLRKRLQDSLNTLEQADNIATKIFKAKGANHESNQQSNDPFQNMQTFRHINLNRTKDDELSNGATYDSHWQVLKMVEIMSQKLHHNLTSQYEQLKIQQQKNPFKSMLNAFDTQSQSLLQKQPTISDLNISDYFHQQNKEQTSQVQHQQYQMHEQQIKHYTQQVEQLNQQISQFYSERQDLQNFIHNQETELNQLNQDNSYLKKTIAKKNQELKSFTNIVRIKKEYEGLVIKASQEMKRKEDECEDKNKVIAKAQQIIIKLNEELENILQNGEREKQDLKLRMRDDIEASQLAYNNLMSEKKNLEHQHEKMQRELCKFKIDNEEQLSQVKKQAEEVIKYFKGEVCKSRQQSEANFKTIGTRSEDKYPFKDLRKSKSQVKFLGSNTIAYADNFQSTSPIKSSMKKSLLELTPSLSNTKNTKLFSDIQYILPDRVERLSQSVYQILMDAYERTLQETISLKRSIESIVKTQETKVTVQIDKSQDLLIDYLDKIEQALNREANLSKIIQKKDIQLKETFDINISLKQSLIEQRQHLESHIFQLQQKHQLYELMESQLLDHIENLKTTIAYTLVQNKELQFAASKQNQTINHEFEVQNSQIDSIIQTLNVEKHKNDNLEQELDRLYKQVDDEIQQRSFIQYSYDKVCETIKELWQNECEAFIQTNKIQITGHSQESINEMLRDLKEQLVAQKQMNELQKEDCYQLLQQMNEYNEHLNTSSSMGQMQQTYQGTQQMYNDYQSTNLSPQSIQHYQRQTTSSCKNLGFQLMHSQTNKSLQLGQQTHQSKRNELYNMLRDEVKRVQNELNNRKEQVVSLKKQLDHSEKAYSQRCDENQLLDKDNQDLIRQQYNLNEEIKTINVKNSNIQIILDEREIQLEQLRAQVELFAKDLEMIQIQMSDLIDQNTSLQDEKDQWKNALKVSESRLNDLNQDKLSLIEQFEDREDQIKQKIDKYKEKCYQKEQQIFDLHQQLEQEINLNQQVASEIEQKFERQMSFGVQTDPDPDYLQLIIENQLRQKEVDHVKNDITTVLNSYDVLKKDFQRLNEIITEQSDELKRLDEEKNQVEETLEKEREFIQRVKKVEKSYNNIVGISQYSDSQYQQDEQAERYALKPDMKQEDESLIVEEFQRQKRNSQSQTRLRRNRTSMQSQDQEYQTQQSNMNQINNYRSQQVFKGLPCQSLHKNRNSQQFDNHQPHNMIQSYSQSVVSDIKNQQQIFSYNQRSKSLHKNPNIQQNQYNEKENLYSQTSNLSRNNFQDQDDQIIKRQSNDTQDIHQKQIKLKKQNKRLMKHFEAIINYVERTLLSKNTEKVEKPPLICRNNSQKDISKKSQKEPIEEILFYQAQTYFYHKNPQLYQKVQNLLKSKSMNDQLNKYSWAYIQTTRKLTSLTLDGALLLNDPDFQLTLTLAQEFLQNDAQHLIENFEQLCQINEQITDGVGKIVNSQSQKMLQNNYQFLNTDITQSSIACSTEFNIPQQHEMNCTAKLKQMEQRLTFNQEILSQLQDYLQHNSLQSLSQTDNDFISPESIWKLICSIQRLAGALKLELNYDVLTLNQTLKIMPQSNNEKRISHGKLPVEGQIYRNESMLQIIRDIYEITFEKIQKPSRMKSLPQNISTIQNQKAVIHDYDQKFSVINEKIASRFLDRLILKLRKNTIQSSQSKSLDNAIDEIDININDLLGETPNKHNFNKAIENHCSEYGLLLLLKENLELRKYVLSD